MYKSLFLFTSFTCLIYSCNRKSDNLSQTDTLTNLVSDSGQEKVVPTPNRISSSSNYFSTDDYSLYVDNMKELDLPFTFSFEKSFPDYEPEEDSIIKRMNPYIPQSGGSPYRKVFETDLIVGIIYVAVSDVQYPYLMIYKKPDFSRVDSMGLYESGGVDDCFYEVNKMTLNEDFTMNFYDSTFTCKTDDHHERIKGADKITIITKNYRIENIGRIKLINKQEHSR